LRELDAKFAEMSEDTGYQEEANLLVKEFETSDWEAAKLLEDQEVRPWRSSPMRSVPLPKPD
jgi:hypothetical protein